MHQYTLSLSSADHCLKILKIRHAHSGYGIHTLSHPGSPLLICSHYCQNYQFPHIYELLQYQCKCSFYTSTYLYLTCPPIAGLDHISRIHIPYALTTVVTNTGDSGMRTIGKQRTKPKHPLVFYMSISVCNEYRQDLAKPHVPLISCATPLV